jgi:hypothetical protein
MQRFNVVLRGLLFMLGFFFTVVGGVLIATAMEENGSFTSWVIAGCLFLAGAALMLYVNLNNMIPGTDTLDRIDKMLDPGQVDPEMDRMVVGPNVDTMCMIDERDLFLR